MNKLLVGLLTVGLFAPFVANAQTNACAIDFSTASDSELRVCLIQLINEVIILEQQQLVLSQQVAQITPPIQNQPIEQTLTAAPQMEKTLTLTAEKVGKGYTIKVVYAENGIPVEGIPVTLTVDNGSIGTGLVASKYWVGQNGELTNSQVAVLNDPQFKVGAVFTFFPTASSQVTAEANGVTQTIQVE